MSTPRSSTSRNAQREVPSRAASPLVETCLVDLGFPCHLACRGCDRTPERPDAYHQARRTIQAALRTRRGDVLRLIFFGGDVFALPSSFEELLEEAVEEAVAQGVTLEGVALSDGTSWSLDRVQRFAALGVRDYRVALDGPAPLQDSVRPAAAGEGFDRILSSLRWHRDGANVEVRADAAIGAGPRRELRRTLEAAGLFEGPHPITLVFGPRLTCRQHAARLIASRPRAPRPG